MERESLVRAATTATSAALLACAAYQYLTYDRRWWWKRRAASQPGSKPPPHRNIHWEDELIHGHVAPGWERVREEFVQNFRARGELGAAVVVYHRGTKVVDLWGGYRDREQTCTWEKDTMVPVFSSTKGVSAFALMMLASQGKLDVDSKIVDYWPEFGRHHKGDITVMELMDHSVGLAGISPPLTLEMLQLPGNAGKRAVRDHLANARMEWPNAGDHKGYMAVILGFYESALVQLTEGSGNERTVGQYLHDEAFAPLGIDDEIYIGLPSSVPDSRIANLDGMSGLEPLWPTGASPPGLMTNLLLRPKSYTARAFANPRLSSMPGVMDYDRREVQGVEMPASGGVATARAIATVYLAAERAISTLNENPLGLNRETLDRFIARPAKPGRNNGWIDEVLGVECCMGSGFLLPVPTKVRDSSPPGRFVACPGGPRSFGAPGAGGSFGFCDADHEIAYSYVMNRCGQFVVDDPREFAIRSKVYEVVNNLREKEGGPLLDLEKVNAPHYLARRYMEAYPELAPLS